MTDMKALLRFPGERTVRLADVPIPALEAGFIRVRTLYSVISPGTEHRQSEQTRANLAAKAWQRPDLVALAFDKLRREGLLATRRAIAGRLATPLPMGYASCGVIEAIGPGNAADPYHHNTGLHARYISGNAHSDLAVGQIVACAGMGYANHAQCNVLPRNLVSPVDPGLDPRAAAFATLYAIGLHALHQAQTGIGQNIAIIGGGLIGQILVQLACCAGAQHIALCEPQSARRELARANGATHAASRATALPDDFYDTVFICSDGQNARQMMDDAARLCMDRATIICIADLPPAATRETLYRKELTIRQVRSYGPGRYDPAYEEGGQDYPAGYVRWTINRNMQAVLALMAQGKINPMALHPAEIAFENAASLFVPPIIPQPVATVICYDNTMASAESPIATTSRDETGETTTTAPIPTANIAETPVATTKRAKAANTMPVAPSDRPIGLAVIGVGNYAQSQLLPHLGKTNRFVLHSISSRRGLSAMAVARKSGRSGQIVKATSDPESIFNDPAIGCVVIATHHDSHANLAIRAIETGKHIWLEKPVCIDRAQLIALRHAWQSAPKQGVFMIGHNRRHAPMAHMLRQSWPDGPVRFDYRVRIAPLPAGHWVNHPGQGGRAIGEISHFIDLMASLVPAKIDAIKCQWINRQTGESRWSMDFTDGSQGEISYLLAAHRKQAKEYLNITASRFDAILKDWRHLQIDHHNQRRTKRHLWHADKGQENALSVFATQIGMTRSAPELAVRNTQNIPSFADECDLMDMILRAARG